MPNTQVVLAKRPEGTVTPECFALRESEVPAVVANGDVLVRNIYLSCDPYMRGQLGDDNQYKSPFPLGDVIPARVVGQVEQSNHADFSVGDFVWGFLGWEHYTLVIGGNGLRKVNPSLGPISHAISVLGMPGLTAYVGMLTIGQPQPGECVFVSAASGAVGQVAAQLARIRGARVVGSAGADVKVDYLQRGMRLDGAFNYKNISIDVALDKHCPDGIDVYFDNVGGATLDAVLARLNHRARVAVCGQISQYDATSGGGYALRNATSILGSRARVEGFSVRDHMQSFDEVVPLLSEWLRSGELVYAEDIVDGIANAPAAFIGMMAGENLGKRLVRIAADPTH